MGFRSFCALMGFGTAISWMAWVIILQTVNPFEAGFVGILFFYVTLFLALVGTLLLGGIIYRMTIRKKARKLLLQEVQTSLRHAILFAGVVIATLMLSAAGQFRILPVLGVLLTVAAIEGLFVAMDRAYR